MSVEVNSEVGRLNDLSYRQAFPQKGSASRLRTCIVNIKFSSAYPAGNTGLAVDFTGVAGFKDVRFVQFIDVQITTSGHENSTLVPRYTRATPLTGKIRFYSQGALPVSALAHLGSGSSFTNGMTVIARLIGH